MKLGVTQACQHVHAHAAFGGREAFGAKMLGQKNPESALRQLLRAESRDDEWYYIQGNILMAMGQYESAHSSYREAVSAIRRTTSIAKALWTRL